ncbi:MAG: hypothetical protein DVB22_003149 [Verrucomicrobia bacterium]|nr:MAG: hypothetical protein DVB22_003149 [Verrucomicrobiota bacterium]
MTVVLDAALESYRRERFLAQAAAAYESVASDPAAACDYRREISDLEGTSADGRRSAAGVDGVVAGERGMLEVRS